MVVYQMISPSLRAACTTFGSDPSCACAEIANEATTHNAKKSSRRTNLIESSSEWIALPLMKVISASGDGPPYRPNGHRDPGFDGPSLYPTSSRFRR